MNKALKVSLVVLMTVSITAALFAQPFRGKMRGNRMMRPGGPRILHALKMHQKELQITDQQLEKIKSLMNGFEEKMIKTQNANSELRLELKKLLQAETKDYSKIEQVLSKTSSSRNVMFIDGLKVREEIMNILTPEQKEKLKEMRQGFWKKRRPFLSRRGMLRFHHFRRNFRR